MNPHLARTIWRCAWLGFEMARALSVFPFALRGYGNTNSRARWLQTTCRRGLRVLGVRVLCHGTPPPQGMLVANHLSYLDILVLAAMAPCTFVSKSEVGSWPMFGRFARLAGTIFVKRGRRCESASLANRIDQALSEGELVVLFPEGTTSDGRTVLPFKSAPLEPAARKAYPLTAARLDYALLSGDAGITVCYWGKMTLLPHLLRLMAEPRIFARVQFAPVVDRAVERKELAQLLHAQIQRMQPSPARLMSVE